LVRDNATEDMKSAPLYQSAAYEALRSAYCTSDKLATTEKSWLPIGYGVWEHMCYYGDLAFRRKDSEVNIAKKFTDTILKIFSISVGAEWWCLDGPMDLTKWTRETLLTRLIDIHQSHIDTKDLWSWEADAEEFECIHVKHIYGEFSSFYNGNHNAREAVPEVDNQLLEFCVQSIFRHSPK
jgi:hypothetical protein